MASDFHFQVKRGLTDADQAFHDATGVTSDDIINTAAAVRGGIYQPINPKAAPYLAVGDDTADDTAALTAAVTAANAVASVTGSAVVEFPDGRYKISAALPDPAVGVKFRGLGNRRSVIHQTGVVNGTTGTYYSIFHTAQAVAKNEFSYLGFEGDNTNATAMALGPQCEAIQVDQNAGEVDIFRCRFEFFWGEGAQSFGNSNNVRYRENIARYNGKDGLNASGVSNMIVGNICEHNAYNGIEAAATDSTISDNQCHYNTQAGIALTGSTGLQGTANTVTGNRCLGNVATGMSVASGIRLSSFKSNICQQNGTFGITLAVSGTIEDNEFTGNFVYSNGLTAGSTKTGIFIGGGGGCVRNRFVGNYVGDKAIATYGQQFGIQDFGTDTEIRDNFSSGNGTYDYDLGGVTTTFINRLASSVTRYRNGMGCRYVDITGTGSPASTVPSSVGGIYRRSDGAGGTTLYVKETASDATDKTGWQAMASATAGVPIGSQAAYSKITSSVTQALSAGAWTQVASAPSITLPNDGFTYRVKMSGPDALISSGANIHIGLGTDTTHILASHVHNMVSSATPYAVVDVDLQQVVGSGQTITVFGFASGTPTLTLVAGVGGTADGPCELAAYRVL